MDCLSNLWKCQASCCKTISIIIHNIKDERIIYYQSKGITIKKLGNKYTLVVPLRCSALSEDNKCVFHGTNEKPEICRRLSGDNTKGFYITEGCIIKDESQDKIVPFIKTIEKNNDQLMIQVPLQSKDMKRYYKLRGCELRKSGSRGRHLLVIPV